MTEVAEVRRYRVELAKSLWAYVTVDVDVTGLDEDEIYERAIERALTRAPRICAQCAGWGRDESPVSDDDEWMSLEEWHGKSYDPEQHGRTVSPVTD